MRLHPSEVSSLLGAARAQENAPSSAAIARGHRQATLRLLARYGHCRTSDIARAVWPDARYAMQMAQRCVREWAREGIILRRVNALRSRSWVLARAGVAELDAMGVAARHGCDLVSVAGATFVHRCIENRYCIERELRDAVCYGEHAIQSGHAPVSASYLAHRYGKLPDCIAVVNRCAVDWCEVESSAKALDEIVRILELASRVGQPFAQNSALQFARVVFVCEANRGHEKRIVRAAGRAWVGASAELRERYLRAVRIARVTLSDGLRWIGCEEKSLYNVLSGR